MNNLKKIESIVPQKGELYLFDACTLLFLFYTPGNYKKEKASKCAKLFSDIISAKAKLLLFPELISEFFNRFVKLEYQTYLYEKKLDYKDFTYKDFRKTEDFSHVIKELMEIYKLQLLPYGEFVYSDITKNDFFSILDNLSELDINDYIYGMISKKEKAKLITDDNDYLLSDTIDSSNLYFVC